MPTATRSWQGNAAMRRLLVPLGDLHTHPRNPRRGNVALIRESLERFGQQRPILALADGTIVAGNHTYRAAEAAEWTHIAVLRSDLTEEEIDAYLLADNRLSALGDDDPALLAAILAPYAETDRLVGTGYEADDLADLLTLIREQDAPPIENVERDSSYAEYLEHYANRATRALMLEYDVETFNKLVAALAELGEKAGDDSHADTILRLVSDAFGRELGTAA